jgi:Ca-activated chloride channel family protein
MQTSKKHIYLSLLLTIFSFVLIAAHANARSVKAGPVHMKPEISNSYVEYNSDRNMFVNMKLWGDEIRPVKRPPVNLILVIDESGSMNEKGKMTYAKKAAKNMINNLNSYDRVGIVAYSDYARVISPLQRLKNKSRLKRKIDRIYPTNATNLSAGLIEGIRELKYEDDETRINKVILLSDGLANRGVTDIYSLSKIASRASSEGIYITTMGLGLHFDEDLMATVAEYGAGNYYFIESPNQIAYIFDKEFGKMASTIARDAVLEIDLDDDVELEELYGYKYDRRGDKILIKLGNYYSGQERNIKMSLKVPTDKQGKNDLFSSKLKYTDIQSGRLNEIDKNVSYNVTRDSKKVVKNENKEVVADMESVKASKDLDTATRAYEQGYTQQAIDKIKDALQSVRRMNKTDYKTSNSMAQEDALDDALSEFESAPASPASDSGKKMIKKYKEESRVQQK